MGYRRDWSGSTATLASTNSSREAEAGSLFAIVGGSTTAISFSDRDRILAGTENTSYLVGISRHESFSRKSRKTLNAREDAQERNPFMPIIEFNDKLTRIVRGRTIQLVAQEEGLVTIVFHDYSTMRVKVAGVPTMNMLGEGRIESVGESEAGLNLVGEDGCIATLRLAEPGSSITVKDENGQVEYTG